MEENQQNIERLLGPGAFLERRGGYFDSLITPIETVISFVENEIPALSCPTELEREAGAFWPRGDLWFFHYFKDVDTSAGDFSRHADSAKVAYLRERFMRLAGRTVFVISNTQNNLDKFCWERSFDELFSFTQERLERLRSALDRRFGACFAGLLVVESAVTACGCTSLPKVVRHVAEADASEWKGNSQAWHHAYRKAIGELLATPAC